MTDHPITPPPEMVERLRSEAPHGIRDAGATRESHLITTAYRAGADQELEACVEWLWKHQYDIGSVSIRAARRPKPPSLKEQALEALGPEPLPEFNPTEEAYLNRGAIERHRILRTALDALPND